MSPTYTQVAILPVVSFQVYWSLLQIHFQFVLFEGLLHLRIERLHDHQFATQYRARADLSKEAFIRHHANPCSCKSLRYIQTSVVSFRSRCSRGK